MGATRDLANRHRTVPAWSGTSDDLKNVMTILEHQLAVYRDNVVRRYRELGENEPFFLSGVRMSQHIGSWQAWSKLVLREKATGDITVREGSAEDLFSTLDSREIVAARTEFFCSDGGARGEAAGSGCLSFSSGHADYSRGIVLTITSSNPEWSAHVADAIGRELAECTPSWAMLRTRIGRACTALASCALLALAVWLLLEPADWKARAVATIAVGLSSLGALLREKYFDHLLPGFEVRSSHMSRGSRSLAFLASAFGVAILVGVLGNRLS